MQAVADFYAGFALFMLVGSLIGLAVLLFQPFFARLRSAPGHRDDSAPAPVVDLPARPRPAAPGSDRKAA